MILRVELLVTSDEPLEVAVALSAAVAVVVLVYVGVCPRAARIYAPKPGATVVDVILGVRLVAE